MPASGGDPVTAALRLSLTASQGSGEEICLDKRLAASTSRVLLTHIEYEPATNSMVNVLDNLKNKYIVLKSQDTEKNGADSPGPTSNSRITVKAQNQTMKPEPDSILPTPKVTLFPPEKVQLGWRGTHYVGAGMINVGNTCYLNSVLQALFHVPAFVNWLHSDSSHLSNCSVSNGSINGECIICAMNKTLKSSQSKSGTVIKPFLIYSKLKFICKHLVHGQQEDAHEFMRYLLESMEKAYLCRYKGTKFDSYSKETTPLNQIFGGYIRTEVTCLQCTGVSTTFQHCQDLLLDIRRASTLDDALTAYFCKERLDGDDAYRCERCHRKVSATKKFSIEKPPQVLCIQLKRFSILGGKINKHVSFTQRLDLTRFLSSDSAPLTYHLVSMVTHVGSSVHCGHYTAVAQTSSGQYYQFDDSSVRPISVSAVLDTNAYIMMYEREPMLKSPAASATITTTTTALNGQKQSQLFNHKPVNNHNPGPTALPPARDRDRVVFGLHQPAASPAPPRLVMHIKNGKVYRPPPQPSPQQQEPSASTAASLVPYCESSSSDSEPLPRLWDMPSLDDATPLCANGTDSVKSHFDISVASVAASCSSVGKRTESTSSFSFPLGNNAACSLLEKSDLGGNNVDSTLPNKSVFESSKPKKTDVGCPSRSRNCSVSPSKGSEGNVEPWRAESARNKIISPVRSAGAKIRAEVDVASGKEVNSDGRKYNSGWQVTEQPLHSPSHASESGASNSTTDWAVSDIKQSKKLSNTEVKVKDEPPWRSAASCSDKLQHLTNGHTHCKKRKHSDSPPSVQKTRIRETDSDIEEFDDKQYNKKHEKKMKKLKKHKKRERASADNGDSKNGEDGFEWVEKTHETLGLNSSYPAESNGHSSWDGARKAEVTTHLTHLSHRGYGNANVTSWSGDRSRMDEEVERDRKEDRKRSYDNSYDDFDRGRVKKMKHHHSDHPSAKYNPFQDYHNYKYKWNSGNYYNKPYYRNGNYHYNGHNSRHKQFVGRSNGYHKYHDRYGKRDHWRH